MSKITHLIKESKIRFHSVTGRGLVMTFDQHYKWMQDIQVGNHIRSVGEGASTDYLVKAVEVARTLSDPPKVKAIGFIVE